MTRKGRAASKGEAGRKGDDVRSDLFVSVMVKKSGGIDLEVASKVGAFYGKSIRGTVESVLAAYGVKNARVRIDDKGALPFVIGARVETALRRMGRKGSAPSEVTITRKGPSRKDRLRRSRLYLPGNEPKFAINAGIHHPDGVILDLEDSVHPSEKDAARVLVRNALRSVDFLGAERMVRINQLPLGLEDLDEIVPESPDVILIPKVEFSEQVRDVDERIKNIQKGQDRRDTVWLMPIIESALGIENAYAIASATTTVCALTIGLEDYTADLGVRKTKTGDESHFARMRLVNAARAAGVQAIDSVFGDVGDVEGLKAWGIRARSMGFEGMGCIHPRQIRPIHEAFAPAPQEIEKALKIVKAFEEASAKGLGVVSLGTRMIDPPVVLRAQRLVDLAKRAGLISDKKSK
ncbi:MAG: citrate lyase ACP [Candidatus Latescibacterota bacterium]|nr:MAG: citrate lyase ACP [Candidatus Latescibacterota bacterium]